MTDSTFWKKISPAVDINDLAGEAEPKSARIKPGSKADVSAAKYELAAWLERKQGPVFDAGKAVLGHLGVAVIWPDNVHIRKWLAEDVAKLALLSRK